MRVSVQPEVSVTTKVYVPGNKSKISGSELVKPAGPVQEYMYPGRPPFASISMLPVLNP